MSTKKKNTYFPSHPLHRQWLPRDLQRPREVHRVSLPLQQALLRQSVPVRERVRGWRRLRFLRQVHWHRRHFVPQEAVLLSAGAIRTQVLERWALIPLFMVRSSRTLLHLNIWDFFLSFSLIIDFKAIFFHLALCVFYSFSGHQPRSDQLGNLQQKGT